MPFLERIKMPFLERIKPEKIELSEKVKGILLYSTMKGLKPFKGRENDWILLVDKCILIVGGISILTHSNFSFDNGLFFINPDYATKTWAWGTSGNRDFYLVPEKIKKYYIKQLSELGFKFVKPLNKLIER